jgi:hypothetical protein
MMLLEVPLVIHLRFPLVFGRSPGTRCFLFPVTLPVSCNCDASRINQDVGLTYLMHRAQHPLFGTMKAEHQRARSANTVDSAVVCRAIVTIPPPIMATSITPFMFINSPINLDTNIVTVDVFSLPNADQQPPITMTVTRTLPVFVPPQFPTDVS